jgi:hypothetical protein
MLALPDCKWLTCFSCAMLLLGPAAAAACRVSAHFVEQPSSNKPTTTILIKFDESVMQRQAALDAAKRG